MMRDRYGKDGSVPTLHVLPMGSVTVSGCMLAWDWRRLAYRKLPPSPGAGGGDDFWARTSPASS